MKNKLFLLLLFSFGCVLDFTLAKKKPNIIFILADDLGWNDVSFHGSWQIPTPNIDTLAYSGLILNNYYVGPVCTPSRAAIMTGKHPIHTGMQHRVVYGDSPYGLPLSERILPEWLSLLGYSTHAVGKWHLGHCKKQYTPTYRGFQSHSGFWTGMEDYYNHIYFYGGTWGYDFRKNMDVDREPLGAYATDYFTDEAVNRIKQHNSSRPLFLYVAHLAVHSANTYDPLQAPPETVEKFSYIKDEARRKYAAMTYKLDESVGRVVEALDEAGLLLNSIIVFSTDNGGPAEGFNINAASNWPLRGVKNTLWEGGIRGAGLLWSPLLKHSGRVATQLMDVEDWLPTLYYAAGGDPRDLGAIDGKNMWESLSQDSPSPREEVLHNIDESVPTAALRKGDWKVINGMTYAGAWDGWYGPSGKLTSLDSGGRSLTVDAEARRARRQQYDQNIAKRVLTNNNIPIPSDKRSIEILAQVDCGPKPDNDTLQRCNPYEAPCLFNIKQDPCEYTNLAEENPDILADLLETLEKYNSTAVPPVFAPSDSKSDPRYYNHMWTTWLNDEE